MFLGFALLSQLFAIGFKITKLNIMPTSQYDIDKDKQIFQIVFFFFFFFFFARIDMVSLNIPLDIIND